eukprot:6189592-Pleurochrysis_carterae.AAC.4
MNKGETSAAAESSWKTASVVVQSCLSQVRPWDRCTSSNGGLKRVSGELQAALTQPRPGLPLRCCATPVKCAAAPRLTTPES